MTDRDTLIDWITALPDYGDRSAVLAFQKEDCVEWSFAQLAGNIDRARRQLNALDLGSGDRVVILAAPQPDWIAACLAVIRCGAIPVPLDVQLSDEALERILVDSEPRLILTDEDTASRLEELDAAKSVDCRALTDLPDAPDDSPDSAGEAPDVAPDDTAVLFYTSGTTGPPKGVPLSHRNLAFEIESLSDAELVSEGDRVLLPLPLHHVYPFVIGMLTPLALGLPLILPHSLTGPQILRAIRDGRCTVIIGVPRLYRALLSGIDANISASGRIAGSAVRGVWSLSGWLRRRLGLKLGKRLLAPLHEKFGPELRMLASGGSAISPDVAGRLEALGWDVGIGYGLTETSPLITLNPPGSGKLTSVGKAIPGVDLRFDPSAEPGGGSGDEPPEKATRGELLTRGPNVFRGYRNMPDKTKEALDDEGWFRTGDLASIDDDGLVYIHGRASTLIVTEGGENVQPDEVEEAYGRHPAIREIGVLERDGKLAALIVPETAELSARSDNDARKQIHDAVGRAVREAGRKLPSYQRIAEIAVTRDALPRTRLGKIQRHKLDERYDQARQEGNGDEEAPGPMPIAEMSSEDRGLLDDPIARKVWKLLADQFSDRRLTPDSSPQLDLGVDSLKWLDLSMEINRAVGVELDEETIARIDTVRDLLHEMASRSERGETLSAEQILQDPEEFLSDEQRRGLRPAGRFARGVAAGGYHCNRWLMRRLFGLQVERHGELPDGAFVLTPNHLSYLDAPAIAASLDNQVLQHTYWAGWTGIMWSNPLLRVVSRLARLVPIEPERGAMSSLAFAAAALQQGKSLIWFPEGRRSPDGELQTFKPGLGLLLAEHRLPVVPAYIEGTREALPPDRKLPRLHKIVVTLGEALDPEELQRQGEGDEAHQRIAQALHDRIADMACATRNGKND